MARGSRTIGVVITRDIDDGIQALMRQLNVNQSEAIRYALQRGLDLVESAEEAGFKAGIVRGKREFRQAMARAHAEVVDTD